MGDEVEAPLFGGMRGVRYGEVLAAFDRQGRLEADVYGTQMLNECPQELWDKLDASAIAAEMGAALVKLNGPRYWVIDGIGAKVPVVEPVLRDFGGITMRRIATVDLGDQPDAGAYVERKVNRGAIFYFDAGKPVYELVAPDGTAYVMQAYCVGVDSSLTEEGLESLGGRLRLPAGWSFRTRSLERGLKIDTSRQLATVLQDELENTYTLPI